MSRSATGRAPKGAAAVTQRRPRRPASAPVLPASLAIPHENLEDKIYRRLRALIVGRQIGPGERIRVDDLAREMAVSRTPVLHALKRLAQERVVELQPRRGIYVRRFGNREMARLFEVREVLEGLAARLAAARIERREVERLARLFRKSESASIAEYVERDRHLHGRLVEIAGNDHLAHAMESVNMMYFAYQDGLIRVPAETLREHRALLAALRRRDGPGSEAAMRRHIRRSVERLERDAAVEESRARRPARGAGARRGGAGGRTAGAGN